MPSISRLDTIYRAVLLSKFFVKGWGDPDAMKKIFKFRKIISNREKCQKLIDAQHPISVGRLVSEDSYYRQYEGKFVSPMVEHLGDLIPVESHIAHFELIEPVRWRHSNLRPLCIQLAGTGDHHFWKRRKFMAQPLIRDYGIASIILENPFYGLRKPYNQTRSSLNNVSDIFTMGGCLILECLALFNWAHRNGYAPICLTGISMGGHNASLAATNCPGAVSVVPCLSWTTASCVFTQGVMSGSVPWKVLASQYLSFGAECKDELKQLINSPEPMRYFTDQEMFGAGRIFAKNFLNLNLSHINTGLTKYLDKVVPPKYLSRFTQLITETLSSSPMDEASKLDSLHFMSGVMDECTHLANFSVPVDPTLAIIINARHDAYVLSDGVIPLTDIWPGSTVRYLDRGHVSAILLDSDIFRQAIADSLHLNACKHYGESLFNREEHYLVDKTREENSQYFD